jgi:MFS family permease
MDSPQPVIESSAGAYEEIPARQGAGGWLFAIMHLGLGAVTAGLALSDDFAAGKAAFASEAWRALFGLVGGGLVFLAVRAVLRAVNDARPRLTPQLHRRGQIWGRVLVVVGLAFFLMAVADPVAEQTVAFAGWVKIFYIAGGAYLTLMGLVLQWNPTRHIRQQRVSHGEGRPGVARIVQASDTGTSVNDAPQVKIDFELEVGGQTHLVSDKIVMQRAHLALLLPGSTVNVLVDKVDPNVFHIDWASWKAPGSA